jgi:Ser/Thr protein kinase RdoA (MazF antagonist)
MLFTKPTNLNGVELIAELATAGIAVERIVLEANGQLSVPVDAKDEAKAATVIAAHNGTTVAPEPTIAEKLASVGLSLEELKTALLA